MDLHLRPSIFFLLFFLINITFVVAPTPVSAIDGQYLNCSAPFRCANLQNIGYPFWGGNRPEYCGYPGFEFDCEGDAPEITIVDITYRILNIDNQSRTFTAARDDYWDDNCPSKLVSTSLNFSLFNYAPDVYNLTLYYRCPVAINDLLATLAPNKFNCNTDELYINNYYFSSNISSFNSSLTAVLEASLRNCENNVVIPVSQPTLLPMVSNPNSVNLTESLRQGFGLQWLANYSLCEECERSKGQCGFIPKTGAFTCYCPDKPYSSSCQTSKGFSSNKRRNIYIGVAVSVVGIIVIITIILFVARRRFQEKTEDDQNVEAFVRNCGALAPKRYNYFEVERMTESFSNKLGQGGYGDVYKGKLPDGRLVAVKVLKESKGNGEEFINEVASISRTSHVNIVNFLGFCCQKKKRALIYEFMPNGSLDTFICDQETSSTKCKLEWRTMFQIAVGIARGLEYLHSGCNIRIVHFDIKPHNILLDEDFCPKISDFGLAKQSQNKESIMSMMNARGTIGYIAPEVFSRTFGGVSHKSDVYSYGMMILEMVGGRKNADAKVSHSSELYFPNSIYKHLESGNDFQFPGVVTEEEKEMAKKMILVSLWCIQTNPSDRPSMHKVVEMLEGSLENLHIPPKPSLSLPTRSAKQSSASPSSLSIELVSLE